MNFLKAALKFLPVIVLAGLMISGQDALVAAPLAWIVAVIVCCLLEKTKFQDCLNASMDSVKHILVALFILMVAYGMVNAFMTYGVGASVVLIALKLGITAKTVACIGVACTGILSVATGTSWGTFAACAPIFLWLSYIVGGDPVLTACAIAGGSCFGDNIGLISDTTIVSSGIQEVQVVDRIRHQGVWSISCLVLAVIAFFIAGTVMGLPSTAVENINVMENITPDMLAFLEEKKPAAVVLLTQIDGGVALYMIIPLLLVIGLAIAGMSTFVCLGTGICSAYLLGLVAGTAGSLQSFLDDILYSGFSEAGSWVVVMMMWVAAFGGVMQKMRAFDPLAKLIVAMSSKVRHLMGWNAVLSLLGNVVLSDEMAQIVTIGPVIKNITDENVEASEEDMYKLRLRNATFGDAMGVFGSQLIPWHVYMGFYVSIIVGVFPIVKITAFDLIHYNFMAMIAVASLLILTFTGLDRFVPLFKLPSEPNVRLKKKAKSEAKAA